MPDTVLSRVVRLQFGWHFSGLVAMEDKTACGVKAEIGNHRPLRKFTGNRFPGHR